MNNKNIKVLNILGRERSGTLTIVNALSKGIIENGIQSDVLILKSGRATDKLSDEGVNTIIVNRLNSFDISLIYKIVKLVKKNQYQILHTHSMSTNLYGRLASIFLPNIKLVTTVHTDAMMWIKDSRDILSRRLLYFLDGRSAFMTDKFIAVSQDVFDSLKFRKYPVAKLILIRSGLDKYLENKMAEEAKVDRQEFLKKVGISPTSFPILINTQRICLMKNHYLLIDAINVIRHEYPEIKVIIVGDGNESERLTKYINNLSLEDHVILTGWVSNCYKYLQASDIYITTSKYESISMAVIEAMYFKKPIISTRVGGLPETVEDGYNGYLFEDSNLDELVIALRKLISSKGAIDSFGSNSYIKLMRDFSEEKMIENTANLYSSMI